jgi:hypothetical protein
MSREHPWRDEHPDAVIVARPTRWGNPYKVVRHREPGCEGWAIEFDGQLGTRWPDRPGVNNRAQAVQMAVVAFRIALEDRLLPYRVSDVVAALAGRDLACWCSLEPARWCHGDVLLQLANGLPR